MPNEFFLYEVTMGFEGLMNPQPESFVAET
jgi:hypothetical protein